MNKTPLLLLVFPFISLMANELSWVDEQIEAIKPSRVGISPKEINQLKDPFVFFHKKKKKEKQANVVMLNVPKVPQCKVQPTQRSRKLMLEATMNRSALINGKWYKVGEKVRVYKLSSVHPQYVELVRGKKKLVLSIKSKMTAIKISK